MFYIVIVHPVLPNGLDGLDKDVFDAFIAENPSRTDFDFGVERIATTNAPKMIAELMAQSASDHFRHPVMLFDETEVPAEIISALNGQDSMGIDDPIESSMSRTASQQPRPLLN